MHVDRQPKYLAVSDKAAGIPYMPRNIVGMLKNLRANLGNVSRIQKWSMFSD